MNANSTFKIIIAAAVVLTILSFSPAVIPAGQAEPRLGGMPYTLWMGILVTIGFVVLTFLGSLFHPKR